MANSGIVDLVHDEEGFEKDMKAAIAASLAMQSRPSAGTTHSSAVVNNEDDELQDVLALSLATYEAEQQDRTSGPDPTTLAAPTHDSTPQSQQRQQLDSTQQQIQARKRSSNFPAAQTAVATQGEATDTGPHKRQRSSPSPAAASNQVSQCGEVDPADDQDTSSSKHGQSQQHSQQLQRHPQHQQVMSQLVAQAAAQLLMKMSHSTEMQAGAACGGPQPLAVARSVSCDAVQQQVQQQQVLQQQQQHNLAMPASLRRSMPLQNLATLVVQQPQQPQQQLYQRQITPGDFEAGSGDWDDNLSDVSGPSTDPQPDTQLLLGSGSTAGEPQQQQQQQVAQQLDGLLQDQQQQDDQQWQIPLHQLSRIGEHLIYQLHDPVYWIDPFSRLGYTGQICNTEACAGAGCFARSYVVDLSDSLIRYVDASSEQLLHRVQVGDSVWCKPNMAARGAWSDRTPQTNIQQQLLQQQLQQRSGSRSDFNVWLGSPWVQGFVVNTELYNSSVPVVEVSLPCGGQCWFAVHALQLVRDTGESSTMAANKGQRPAAAVQQVDDDVVLVDSAAGAGAGHADDLADTAAAPPGTTATTQQPGDNPATAMQLDPQTRPADLIPQQQQRADVVTDHPAVVSADAGAPQLPLVSDLAAIPAPQPASQRRLQISSMASSRRFAA